MAYIGTDEYFPLWLQDIPTDDLFMPGYLELVGTSTDASSEEEEPLCGYIIQDWFGPFLLGPPSRFLRGRC
jgi:hypothetical protein